MPRNNGRKGKRKSANNVTRAVTVVSPADAMERSLAQRQDATQVQGKFLVTNNLSVGTIVVVSIFSPGNFGARTSAIGPLFTRYRFKYVNIKFFYVPTSSNTGGTCALGILDDYTGEGDAPVSIGGVLELRCSATNYASQTVPTEMLWKPPSPSWNFTYAGASGSDERLVSPVTLYAIANQLGTVSAEIMFSMVFKGAADVGSS